jgi:hypothetical protein
VSRYLVFPTQADAQRVIDAIDAQRPATETLVRRERGLVVETVEVPRKTWAVPVELEGGGWGVPFPGRKVNPAWEGRVVDVRGTPTRIPTRAEVVEREVASVASATPVGDPTPIGRIR